MKRREIHIVVKRYRRRNTDNDLNGLEKVLWVVALALILVIITVHLDMKLSKQQGTGNVELISLLEDTGSRQEDEE
jgi:hypothetical protein